MDRKVKVAQYGCGKMSLFLMRYVLEHGAELVAAFDMDPAVIGKDVGEHLGKEPMGLKISDAKEADAILKEKKPDVCVIATRSTMAELKEAFSVCAVNGVNAISTCEEALKIAERYHLTVTEQMRTLLSTETPKSLDNVETHITGSVRQLCIAAEEACKSLGYEPVVLTASLSCTARDAGVFLANISQYHADTTKSLAFIAGGETVVHLTGKGLGGRNQELALSAAPGIAGVKDAAVFSLGSDGTDGPTDAAGGYVDSATAAALKGQGIDPFAVLADNDSYHALEKCEGLIKTGATGTNVNDISVLLIKR